MQVVAIVEVIGVGTILVRDHETFRMAQNLLKCAMPELKGESAKVVKLENAIENLKNGLHPERNNDFTSSLKEKEFVVSEPKPTKKEQEFKKSENLRKEKSNDSKNGVSVSIYYKNRIMKALWDIPDMNSEDIAMEIGQKKAGIHPYITQLEEDGYIKSEIRKKKGQPGRGTKFYGVTNKGKKEFSLD